MRLLELLDELVNEGRARGPAPKFSESHILMLLLILRKKRVGRKRLSNLLSIGEGSVRSIIKKLTELGIIATGKEGCYLTDKGRDMVDEFLNVVIPPTRVRLKLVGESYVSVIRAAPQHVDVIRMRDQVVRHGGSGALILIMSKSGLIFPESGDRLGMHSKEDELTLLRELDLREGDLILVGIGEVGPSLAHAVLSAVLTYIREIR